MAIQEICEILRAEELAPDICRLVLQAPDLTARAVPGQFVHIACGEGNLLRRPISICDAAQARLTVVFAVKGTGTRWLSERRAGEKLDLLGPLGRGFDLSALGERPAFIGGGIGVPPMLYALRGAKAAGCRPEAILGFRNRAAVILEEEFKSQAPLFITTDDGSYSRSGLVSDILQERLGRYTAVCACGPRKMLQALAALAEGAGLPCQVSLEERMGCGIGACLVCACALRGEEGQTRYGHVCKDGPVFDSKEVVW